MLIKAKTFTGPGISQPLNQGDDLIVGVGVTLQSTDNAAVFGQGGGHVVTIQGIAAGTGGPGGDIPTLLIGGDGAAGNRITIGKTGVVANSGDAGAVSLIGKGAILENAGLIRGDDYCVFLGGDGGGQIRIVNSGTISAAGNSAAIYMDDADSAVLVNSGRILMPADGGLAYSTGLAGRDTILNRGVIVGRIYLGDGGDVFDGRGGKVRGAVEGAEGNDRFIPGAAREVFDGGNGFDS